MTVRRFLATGISAVVVGALMTTGAMAGRWTVEPKLSASVSYTDNVDLDATNKRSDVVFRVSPGVRIQGTGARARVNIDYTGSFLWFADESREQWRNGLLSNIFLEPVEGHLFVDVRATIAQPLINDRGAFSFSNDNFSSNRRETIGISASPYFRHRLGDIADVEWRYTLRFVDVAGPPREDPDGERINDYLNHVFTVDIDSGQRFGRFRWGINAFYDLTGRRFAGNRGEDIRARLNVEYRVLRWLGLLGSVGWERIDAAGFEADGVIDDVTWNAGIRLNPTRNTDVTVRYGRNAGDDNFDVHARYTRKRFQFVLRYNEDITTSQRRFIDGIDGGSFNDDGVFVDGLGNPIDPNDLVFGFTDEAFRYRRLSFETRYEHRRTTASLFGYYDRRSFSSSDNTVHEYGARFTISRQFNPKARGTFEFLYDYEDFDRGPGRRDHFFGIRTSFHYDFSRYFTTVLSYVYSNRNSNQNQFDSTGNTVTLSVQANF